MENQSEECNSSSDIKSIIASFKQVSDSMRETSKEVSDNVQDSKENNSTDKSTKIEKPRENITKSDTPEKPTRKSKSIVDVVDTVKNTKKIMSGEKDLATNTKKIISGEKDLVATKENKDQALSNYETQNLKIAAQSKSILHKISRDIELLRKNFDKDRLSELEAAREKLAELSGKKETKEYALGKIGEKTKQDSSKQDSSKGPGSIASFITSALSTALAKPLGDGISKLFGGMTSKIGSKIKNMIGLGGATDELDDMMDGGMVDADGKKKKSKKGKKSRRSKKAAKTKKPKKKITRKAKKTRKTKPRGKLGKIAAIGGLAAGALGISSMFGGDADAEDAAYATDEAVDGVSAATDVADVATGPTPKTATGAKTPTKAPVKPKGAAPKAKGMIAKAGEKTKDLLGKGTKAIKGIGSKIGGLFGKVKEGAEKLAKGKLGKIVSKMGPKIAGTLAKAIGPVISVITSAVDLYSTVKEAREEAADDPKKAKEKVGLSIAKGIGKIGGSVAGGFAGTLLPVPGVGTIIGSLAGDFVGGFLGEQVGKILGGEKIYDILEPILKPLGLSIDFEAAAEKAAADDIEKRAAETDEQVAYMEKAEEMGYDPSIPNLEDEYEEGIGAVEQKKRRYSNQRKQREFDESKPKNIRDAEQKQKEEDIKFLKGEKSYQPTPKPAAPSKESSTSQSISVNEAAKTAGQPTKQAAAGVNQINVSNSSNSYSSDSGTARFPAPEMMRRRT